MKKVLLSLIAIMLVYSYGNIFAQGDSEQEKNKKIALKYHELNPADIDDIITVDFVGKSNEMTWNRENHLNALNTTHKQNKVKDKIVYMVAEDDMVAIKFIRMGETNGKAFSVDVMQFMKLVDGKIVAIWELYDPGQYESQIE